MSRVAILTMTVVVLTLAPPVASADTAGRLLQLARNHGITEIE